MTEPHKFRDANNSEYIFCEYCGLTVFTQAQVPEATLVSAKAKAQNPCKRTPDVEAPAPAPEKASDAEPERPEDAGEVVYDLKCEDCDGPMVKRYQRRGGKPFAGCKDYPRCTHTTKWLEELRLDRDVEPEERQGTLENRFQDKTEITDDDIPF